MILQKLPFSVILLASKTFVFFLHEFPMGRPFRRYSHEKILKRTPRLWQRNCISRNSVVRREHSNTGEKLGWIFKKHKKNLFFWSFIISWANQMKFHKRLAGVELISRTKTWLMLRKTRRINIALDQIEKLMETCVTVKWKFSWYQFYCVFFTGERNRKMRHHRHFFSEKNVRTTKFN